jgi:hypothetical protein
MGGQLPSPFDLDAADPNDVSVAGVVRWLFILPTSVVMEGHACPARQSAGILA